jgi:hypothetical protein
LSELKRRRGRAQSCERPAMRTAMRTSGLRVRTCRRRSVRLARVGHAPSAVRRGGVGQSSTAVRRTTSPRRTANITRYGPRAARVRHRCLLLRAQGQPGGTSADTCRRLACRHLLCGRERRAANAGRTMLTMRGTSSKPLLASDPVGQAMLRRLLSSFTLFALREGVHGSYGRVARRGKPLGEGRLFGDGCVSRSGCRVGMRSPFGPSRWPCGVAGA